MRLLATLLIVFYAAAAIPQQMDKADVEHTAWIDHVMRDIATIKPGMTRADVLRIFREEGGLSTVKERTYVYAHCPYIKVTFTFDPVEKPDAEGRVMNESPNDKVVSMTRPFLDYSVYD